MTMNYLIRIFATWLTFSGVVMGFTIPSTFFFNNSEFKNSIMESKQCAKCGIVKSTEFFPKYPRSKDGFYSYCKDCEKKIKAEYNLKRKRTFMGVSGKIYNHQRYNSKKRGHALPNYTLEEFRVWFKEQPNFQMLWDNWVASDYDRWKKPSCDRNKSKLPYTFDNLTLMTWKENADNANQEMKKGVFTSLIKKVIATNVETGEETEFISFAEASRVLNIDPPQISFSCSGYRKTAINGYTFKKKI